MINFLHTFQPTPILFSLGPINIYWYGFFVVFGIMAALLMTIKLSSYYEIGKEIIIDLAFYLILFGIIGARIYDVFLEAPYYIKNPIDIFKIWNGGLAIHGGIIAGAITLYIFTKRKKINFWLMSSLVVPGLALAQAIGRWGNYFNQELFGLPTNAPWGIPISQINRPFEYFDKTYFHPTFLYESIGSLIIFAILISIHTWIIKKNKQQSHECSLSNVNCQPKAGPPWADKLLLVTCYLVLYSLLRFSLEFIRIDATPLILGLRLPQIASLVITSASIIILLKNKKKHATIN